MLLCRGLCHIFSLAATVLSWAERSNFSLVGELSALIGGRYAGISYGGLCFLPEIRVDIGGATAGISRFTRLLLLLPQHFLHFERGGRSTLPSSRAFERISETL